MPGVLRFQSHGLKVAERESGRNRLSLRLSGHDAPRTDRRTDDCPLTTPPPAPARGWDCANFGDSAIFTHIEDGKVAEQIGYAIP
jgi:hypothetical protein